MTEQITPLSADATVPAAEPAPVPLGAFPPPPNEPPVVGVRPPRRVLRAVARWTLAAVVFAGVGGGVAYGITGMDRDDVPGLATRSDGRWDYPKLSLPALPAGSPRPFTVGNDGEIHYADLRKLLLPAPAGAVQDKKLTGGWISNAQYLSEYEADSREVMASGLRNLPVRHIAARGWTMPDGTSTRIYLLAFLSVSAANDYKDAQIQSHAGLDAGTPLTSAPQTTLDNGWPGDLQVSDTSVSVFTELKPYGATHVRQAYVLAGDTLALVIEEKKGTAPAVPFHQTLLLQSQLLG
ncbi:hypothetical protein HY68_08940 [Streptomyces sp. AcH 505]|uniref:hypothetical protein n=1 Tax=Streptomyces sp. AcH 505 TaxID=352211 RepID=UPI00059188E9|nr:hypothetical protein HY68_08940 [Streptomyces sp. AcH 505]